MKTKWKWWDANKLVKMNANQARVPMRIAIAYKSCVTIKYGFNCCWKIICDKNVHINWKIKEMTQNRIPY